MDNTAHELETIEEEKVIEVIIESKLEFDKHINNKINKTSSIMEVIRRFFTTLNQNNSAPSLKLYLGMTHLYNYIWSKCAETCNKAASWNEGYSIPGET